MWVVVSLGGSLIVQEEIQVEFLRQFVGLVERLVQEGLSFVIITGGGKLARTYQEAGSKLKQLSNEDLDWIGIQATRMNARLVQKLFAGAAPELIRDPENDALPENARIIIGAGWKPGWSTDYDAVTIAARIGAKRVINLSNISHVYAEDPRKNPAAKKFEQMTWKELLEIIGEEWSPGLNAPFDPIAAKRCAQLGITVEILSAERMENVEAALKGEKFAGTVISG